MDLQFYPTPEALAHKAYSLFKNKDIKRLLEPSAGRGDLLAPLFQRWSTHYGKRNHSKIDCCEINLENQAILRAKGVNVVDSDFMEFSGASMYSHILMNPPFNAGVDHVVKAFDLLVNGELVAIVNAETVKNPFSSKRKLLCSWIEEHGSVEFVEQAFMEPDTKVKTTVEVALIWLQKKADVSQSFTQNLEIEHVCEFNHSVSGQIAVKQSSISNAVAIFNAAVRALKVAEVSREEADYYARLLGRPLHEMHLTGVNGDTASVQDRFNAGYDDLKKRAWTNILHSTEFDKYLSSKAYQKLVADFDAVSKLSFTESNIRSFLIGLINGQSEMNLEMVIDCFDMITKYRPENRAYYKGWKSNEKHRVQAYRVKMTRFIIPIRNGYGSGPDYNDMKLLQDFDKTFAMLDGKQACTYGLHELFKQLPDELKRSKRMTTDYFEVRWYKKAGTLHFYPRSKTLVDRLNRLVGKERSWLPQDDGAAPGQFWGHYNDAEKITEAMVLPVLRWGSHSDEAIEKAHSEACEASGYDLSTMFALEAA